MTDPMHDERVTAALRAVHAGDALDWRTAANILAAEVLRQRADIPAVETLLANTTRERDSHRNEIDLLWGGGLRDMPRLQAIEGRARSIVDHTSEVHTGLIAQRAARHILEGA